MQNNGGIIPVATDTKILWSGAGSKATAEFLAGAIKEENGPGTFNCRKNAGDVGGKGDQPG